jgi:D-tyrosyl-tRNA(Tyr) deacylase
VQRVDWAQAEVDNKVVGQVQRGLLVYLSVDAHDGEEQAAWLAEKLANLRLFEDEQGKLNLSVQDTRGGVLVVPDFVLAADPRTGCRSSLTGATSAKTAQPLQEHFAQCLRRQGVEVQTGQFRAEMKVLSQTAGPMIIIDSLGT